MIGTAFSHMGMKPVGGDRQRLGDSASSEGRRPPGRRCSSTSREAPRTADFTGIDTGMSG